MPFFPFSIIDLQIINYNIERSIIIMALHGWEINLSGADIPVYGGSKNWSQQGSKIGTITKNECFVEGTEFNTGWEGWGSPVIFKNSSGVMTQGAIADNISNLKDFASYASNGTSWVSVSTLKRTVQFATRAYYADGSLLCDLPEGSSVWLTANCTRGQKNKNYIAVTAVQPKGKDKITFSGNGFIDLTYGNRWLNVGSILLRKA